MKTAGAHESNVWLQQKTIERERERERERARILQQIRNSSLHRG